MSKISIDLGSSTSIKAGARGLNSEQAQELFSTCLLVLERLGDVADMIEVITVRNYFNTSASNSQECDILFFRVKVVLVEPIAAEENNIRKFAVETEISFHDHTPTSVEIADTVVGSVIDTILEQVEVLGKNRSRMTYLLRSVVPSSEAA